MKNKLMRLKSYIHFTWCSLCKKRSVKRN